MFSTKKNLLTKYHSTLLNQEKEQHFQSERPNTDMSEIECDMELLMSENSSLVVDNTIEELKESTLRVNYKIFFTNIDVPIFNTELLICFRDQISAYIRDHYKDMNLNELVNFYKIPYVLPYKFNDHKITSLTPSTGSKDKLLIKFPPPLPDSRKSQEISTQDLVERFKSLETKIIEALKRSKRVRIHVILRKMLQKMCYDRTEADQKTEKALELAFMDNGLGPVGVLLNFVSEECGGSMKIYNGVPIQTYITTNSALRCFQGASAATDILITQKDEKGCIRNVAIEIKKPSIYKLLDYIKGIPYKDKNVKKYDTIFGQIIAQMLIYKSPIAALSDGQDTLILRYTGEDFEILDGKANIPFEYFVINECSTKPPSAENLTSRILLSIIVEFGYETRADTEVLLQKLAQAGNIDYGSPRIVSRSLSKKFSPIIYFSEDNQECFAVSGTPIKEILSEGDLKVVIKCDGDDLVNCWGLRNSDHLKSLQGRELVVKIYDISRCKHYYKLLLKGESYTYNEFLEYWNQVYQESYLPEISALQKIQQHNDICSDHKKINTPRMLLTGEIRSFGFNGCFLVFEYLPFVNNKPMTQSHVESGIQQLKLLHKLGIVHGDIASRNVCVDEKDNVYLIDFDCAREVDGEVAEDYKLGDIYDMKDVVEHSRL